MLNIRKIKTMAELKKDSNLYAAFERICPMLRANNLNLTSDAACAGIGEALVNTIIDELGLLYMGDSRASRVCARLG